MKKKKEMLIAVLGIISIVFITVGVTYAFFNYAKQGTTENSVESGSITFLYTEISKVGKGIEIRDAYPISDELGKVQVGEGKVFDFKITSNTSNKIGIPYEVTARKKSDSTLDEKVVKIYLAKVNGELEEELLLEKYSELPQTTRVEEERYIEKTIYEGKVPANSSNYEENFRLRMWIDENTDFSPVKGESGEDIYPYNNKTFTITVNVYATGKVVTEGETTKIYGIKRLLTTESSSWERTDDGVGLVANAQVGTTSVQNDFDSIYPWNEIRSYNYDTNTKQVTAYYGEDNFSFHPTDNIEVLTYIPEFYYKREQKDGYEYISITKEKQEGYTKSEAFSVGRYTMSGDATRVHSRSGHQPLADTTITDFRTYARALGEGFGQLDYHYFILQLLYLVEYADYNSQLKLGLGYANVSHTGPTISGGCDILGMHSGSVDGTDNTSIIYRGIEDIFGNIWQFIDGINMKDNQAYVCYDQNEYVVDKYDECYQSIGYVNNGADELFGYISKLGYDSNQPLVSFPIAIKGMANTYVGDYYYQVSGTRIPVVGGNWQNSTAAGLWYWSFTQAPGNFSAHFSSRLLRTN